MDQTTELSFISGIDSECGCAAFGVHVFHGRCGAGIALIAMLEAVREHWVNMFGWLGRALIIEFPAIDGPMARKLAMWCGCSRT